MSKKPVHPPYLAKKLLSFMRNYSKEYSSGGDLVEEYREIAKERGRCIAYLWYWWQVLYAIPTYILLQIEFGGTMFKNYLYVALRNMKRQKGYSLINISGLAIGMTCSILIFLFIQYEISYDKYHENADDIYRVNSEIPITRRGTNMNATSPGKLAPALVNDFPEVLRASRIKRIESTISCDDIIFTEKKFFYTDPEFLKIFTFPLIFGDPETALKEPYSLLITEKIAEKYFGNENPLNKTLLINNRNDYQVTGILKNPPNNSHFTFDFLASISTLDENVFRWNSTNYIGTYIQLQKHSNPDKLENKLPEFLRKYMGENTFWRFHLQPLTSIHLHGNIDHEIEVNSDIKYIYIFSAVAFLIMLIACFNYMNLSTARSANRTKEIGVRKVFGAERKQIIRQFIFESMIFAVIAFFISILLIKLFLPTFNLLIDRNLEFAFFHNGKILLGLVILTILVGIISGSYPAFFLSTFHPIHVIKGKQILKSASVFRNSLVVFQFVISIVLIISVLIINIQGKYINKNLGFNKDHIVIVDSRIENNLRPIILNELNQYPHISGTSLSSHLPPGINSHTGSIVWEGKNDDERSSFYEAWIDYEFLDFYGLELLKGRNFSEEFPSDARHAYIINETAVRTLGWENPIGKEFGYSYDNMYGEVIGVVKDFHHWSFHLNIEPIVFSLSGQNIYERRILSIKINSNEIHSTLAYIEGIFKKYSQPLNYSFLDDRVNKMYTAENKLERILNCFSLIAIFIGCLGLFGLITLTSERRTKEIGIRKVIGATVINIIFLLSKDLVKLVLIANIIAWPIAYYAMNKWLQNFAYRIDIGLGIFLISGVIALIIALLIVSYKAIKAATANPVDSLRYE